MGKRTLGGAKKPPRYLRRGAKLTTGSTVGQRYATDLDIDFTLEAILDACLDREKYGNFLAIKCLRLNLESNLLILMSGNYYINIFVWNEQKLN